MNQGMIMHRRRLSVSLLALAAGLSLVACSPSDTTTASSTGSATGAAAGSTSTGVYGAPVDPSAANPTDVATDAPVPTSAPAEDGEVPVRLSYSGYNTVTSEVEVDGYVPGVAESDGTCTLTLAKDGTSVTATVPGTENVHDTDCGGAAVSRDDLSPGTWRAVLAYESDAVHGASDPVEVVVP